MLVTATVLIIGVLASILLLFWLHREGQASKHLDMVVVSGFDKIAQKELHDGTPGSGDYPPPAEAYFVGPAGNVEITASGFTVTKVDPPSDNPATKMTLMYRGEAPGDCSLEASRLYPTAELPSWAKLSAKQRSALESRSAQVIEVEVMCGG
ncbi:hypothetical protein ABH933_006855 [Nocardia sp. GP40]